MNDLFISGVDSRSSCGSYYKYKDTNVHVLNFWHLVVNWSREQEASCCIAHVVYLIKRKTLGHLKFNSAVSI